MRNKVVDKVKRSIEKGKKRIISTKKRKIVYISLIILALFLIGIYIIRSFYLDQNKIEYNNYKLYQYFSGLKVEYTGKVAIKRDQSITSIKVKDKNMDINMENIPIYFQKDESSVLFPENISLVYLREKTTTYRLNYFTRLEFDKTNNNESAFVTYKGKKAFIEKSFLFDGDNLYFFPYSTDVVIEGKTYNLSPLSYIIVNYKDCIEMYDKKTDKYTIIDNHEKDVIATIDNYKINLSTDMIIYDRDTRLLRRNVDKLDLFNFEK